MIHLTPEIITPQKITRMKSRNPLTRKASVTLKKRTLTLSRMKQMMTSISKITSDSKLSWKPKKPRSVSLRANKNLHLNQNRTTIGPQVMRKTMKVRTKRSSGPFKRSEEDLLLRRLTKRDMEGVGSKRPSSDETAASDILYVSVCRFRLRCFRLKIKSLKIALARAEHAIGM
jgi:hypothetical protein